MEFIYLEIVERQVIACHLLFCVKSFGKLQLENILKCRTDSLIVPYI